MNRPHVSLYIPCFNEQAFLPQFLDSLSNQRYTNFSATFFENSSTDESRRIISDYQKLDPRIGIVQFEYHVPRTVQGMRIRSAPRKGPLIGTRSVNDIIHVDFLEETVRLLEEDPTVGLAYSHGRLLDLHSGVLTEADSVSKIDTRRMNLEDSVFNVVSRYTQPFSLWGLFRSDVFDKLSFQYCYGADHVLVCEASLYGHIASTDNALVTMTMTSTESTLDSIARMWETHHPVADRGIKRDSVFMSPDILLPFTSMINGHLRMIAGAMISDTQKLKLQRIAFQTLRARFKSLLDFEHRGFIEKFMNISPKNFVSGNLAWGSNFLECIYWIRVVSPELRSYCDSLIKSCIDLDLIQ